MDKGFSIVDSARKSFSKNHEPFFKIANGDYEYVENINFQHSKYECLALPYGYFVSAMLAGNDSLHIIFNNWEVFLEGKNLKPIYTAILDRTLKSVRKAEEGEYDKAEYSTYISDLQVKDSAGTILGKSSDEQSDINPELEVKTKQE